MDTTGAMSRFVPGPTIKRLALLVHRHRPRGRLQTPSAHTFSRNYGQREDLPFDPPNDNSKYEDGCAEGGRLFKNYCGSCHNARPLSERPFANYQVAVAHMRDQAYLTGKEYHGTTGLPARRGKTCSYPTHLDDGRPRSCRDRPGLPVCSHRRS